jgi:biotin carboxylase
MDAERGVVLVVGTTPDYIDWIRRSAPGEALFLTDPAVWQGADETPPEPREEIRCDLADFEKARQALAAHLASWNLRIDGIACYDCESMALAALIAADYGLPYPSGESISRCRDKFLSKQAWKAEGLACPEMRHVRSEAETIDFLKELDAPLVLKPVSGAGSELIFLCSSPDECKEAWRSVKDGLAKRLDNRLYRFGLPPEDLVIAEEHIAGEEFSCDFIIENGKVDLIRLARKIRAKNRPFGTIEGYLLIDAPPEDVANDVFTETLRRAAGALSIHRAICMVDFIVRNNAMELLEMAPRPGGDCLPFLLARARQLDIIRMHLDFARRRPVALPEPATGLAPYLGVRLLANRAGILKGIDAAALAGDPRIPEIGLFRKPGHRITLPPADYDSWVLGFAIVRLEDAGQAEGMIAEVNEKIVIEVA